MDPLVYWYGWVLVLLMWAVSHTTGFGVFSIVPRGVHEDGLADTSMAPCAPVSCLDHLDAILMDVDDVYTALPGIAVDLASPALRDSTLEDVRYKLEGTLDQIRSLYDCLEPK